MSYEVKNVKGFMGSDCPGYNATLYRDGKKVALVINDGSGGQETVHWYDVEAPRVDFATNNYKGDSGVMRCTPEQAMLMEHLKGKKVAQDEVMGEPEMSLGMFLAGLVDDFENNKRFKKMCKSKTLYRVKGDKQDVYRVCHYSFNRAVKSALEMKFGDQLEVIFNEKFGQVA